MILNEKNKTPFLTFGLGRKEITVNVGTVVKIYQTQIFSDETFLTYNNARINNYTFDYTANEVGEFYIYVKFISRVKTEKLSTPIKITVV